MDRQKFNDKRIKIGSSIEINVIQLIGLFVVNISLASIIVNLFLKGAGTMEWWSAYVSGGLIFSYLLLRIFTSTGVILGRQVTLLITVFNLFLNLFKFFGIVHHDSYWELTFLIPFVNLLCMALLIFAFIIKKKKFRTIIVPSFNITLFSILPIVRLYINQGSAFNVPIFAAIVLILAVALFANSLILNWLTLKKVAEENIVQIKKGVNDFKRAGEKVAIVNKKVEGVGKSIAKVKSFYNASAMVVKEFFTFRKKNQPELIELLDEKEAQELSVPQSNYNEPIIEVEIGNKRKIIISDLFSSPILKKAGRLLFRKRKHSHDELAELQEQELVLSADENNYIEEEKTDYYLPAGEKEKKKKGIFSFFKKQNNE